MRWGRNAKNVVVAATVPVTLEKFFPEYVRQLEIADFRVWLVCSPTAGLDAVRDAYPRARIVTIPMIRGISPLGDAVGLVRWIALIFKVRPRMLVTMTPKASLLGHLAAWIARVPDRLYATGGLRLEGSVGPERMVLWVFEKITCLASSDVVANSPSLGAAYRANRLARPPKLRWTSPGSSHGVNVAEFHPQSREMFRGPTPVVGFVGRLTEDKGIVTLLDACDSLSKRMAFTLLIVGPDDEPDSDRIVRRMLSSSFDVEYVGAVEDVRPYLCRMELLALPSRREGFPNVVLEAAAMGVPSVVADSTGTCDSVRHGQTGLVVPVDDPNSLAAAIERLLSEEPFRSALGIEARVWASTSFVPQLVVSEILGLANRNTSE